MHLENWLYYIIFKSYKLYLTCVLLYLLQDLWKVVTYWEVEGGVGNTHVWGQTQEVEKVVALNINPNSIPYYFLS